jgi:predicted DNA-binding WGR domain protein
MSGKRMFEFVEGSSSKFWEVWREGQNVYTRYGRIGSNGQTTIKDEGSEAKAEKLYDKLVREKTGKGYVEKGGSPAAAAPAAAPAAKAAAPPKAAPAPVAAAPAPAAAASSGEFRRFEFQEGGSAKFWEIRLDGTSHIVRFGKIGTTGQEKAKDFGSDGAAQKDYDKLIAEKTKKGYSEVAGAGPPVPPIDPVELKKHLADLPRGGTDPGPFLVFADWLLTQGHPWGQLIMVQHGIATESKAKVAELEKEEKALVRQIGEALVGKAGRDKNSRFVWHYGFVREATLASTPEAVEATLDGFLAAPASHMVEGIVFLPLPKDLGTHQDWDDSPDDIVDPWEKTLSSVAAKIPASVKHVGFGGWPAPAAAAYVRMPNLAKVSKALPKLETLELTGNCSELGRLDLSELRSLTVRFADAESTHLEAVASAKIPSIERLSVWLGGQSYCVVDDVIEYDYDSDEDEGGYPERFAASELEGMETHDVNMHVDANALTAFLSHPFPQTLKHIGINSADLEGPILEAILDSPLVKRVETLDLSCSKLNDSRAEVLLKNKKALASLKTLDVSHCQLTKDMVKKLHGVVADLRADEQSEHSDQAFFFRYTATME